jgi:hypothetical protein
MNCVLCVGTPPTFVTVDGVWGSVGYIWEHLDRDQVDTPELRSNRLGHTAAGLRSCLRSAARPKLAELARALPSCILDKQVLHN